MDQNKIGNFIKKIRKNSKLTQQQFASKYGVTYQAVSNWEQGKNLPDISLLKQISDDFNVSIDELLKGEKTLKKNKTSKKIYLILIIIVILFTIVLSIIILNSEFEFKTISSKCPNFNISGSICYNHNKTSIYINNIDYCGNNDNSEYINIECSLYQQQNNIETKISSCNYAYEDKIKLEDYLQNIEFTINDSKYKFTNQKLFLRINATLEDGKVITYKVPLSLNDICSN